MFLLFCFVIVLFFCAFFFFLVSFFLCFCFVCLFVFYFVYLFGLFLSLFFWPLYCLFFLDWRLINTTLVSSNVCYNNHCDFKGMLLDVKNNSTKICFCGNKRFNQSWNKSPFIFSLTTFVRI